MNKQSGFTVIELLIEIVIFIILMLVIFYFVKGVNHG